MKAPSLYGSNNTVSKEDFISIITSAGKGPEQIKFEEWFEREKEKGMIDFKVDFNRESIREGILNGTKTLDDVYKELNVVNDLIAKGDYTIYTDEEMDRSDRQLDKSNRVVEENFKNLLKTVKI